MRWAVRTTLGEEFDYREARMRRLSGVTKRSYISIVAVVMT